jgi:hypothetical protein
MERKQNKNDALEALDFIINVLKEHEKDLDRLINQLGIITESVGETGELADKIESIEDRISNLQGEITNLIKNVSTPQSSPSPSYAPFTNPVKVKCKNWDDFKDLADHADYVSYVFKVSENVFQADALKNGKIVSYIGEFPSNSSLLKFWLSKQLDINENLVFEGVLNIN